MAFNIGKFNEISIRDKANSISSFVADQAKATINQAVSNKRWFGHSPQDAQRIINQLYGQGQILTANYFMEFSPYKNSNVKSLPMLKDSLTGYLCTEASIPVLNLTFEQVQLGMFQASRLTGSTVPEIQLTLLETADGRIINSMLQWLGMMVNKDGTVNPPATYAMRLKSGMFSKDFGLDVKPIQLGFLICPSVSNLDSLNAMAVSEVLTVPVTFQVLRTFME